MPEKSRTTEANMPTKRAGRYGTLRTIENWYPWCGQPDIDRVDPLTPVDWEDDTYPGTYLTRSEWICYTNSRFKRMNACHHIESRCDVNSDVRLLLSGNRVIEYEDDSDCDYPYYNRYETSVTVWVDAVFHQGSSLVTSQLIKVDPYLLLDTPTFREKTLVLERIALDTMIPKLDDGWSLPQALVEAIELKKLFRDGAELLAKLPEKTKLLFSKPLAEISDHFLAGIFGWLPFVNDVKTFIDKYQNVADDVFNFLNNADKRQTLHFQKALSPLTFRDQSWFDGTVFYHDIDCEEDSPWDSGAEAVFSTLSYKTKLTRHIPKISYHATLEFMYSIPGLPPGLKQVLAELDYWGVNLSISDVWEVVPFSFVVDWFIDVGSWLEGLDLENLPVQVNILDYCWSIKYQLVEEETVDELTEITLKDLWGNYYNPSHWNLTPSLGKVTRVTNSYYRRPGIPVPSAEQLPNWQTPGGLQWVIGAALVGSRTR